MNYKNIADSIYAFSGKNENIKNVTHCMTRLRLEVNDKEKFDVKKIEAIKGIKGVQLVDNQYQVIIGMGDVDEVYKEFIKLLPKNNKQTVSNEATKDRGFGTVVNRIIRGLSDIFIPIIPILVASGVITGLAGLCIYPGYFSETQSLVELYPQFSGLATMLNMFSDSVFYFLPVLIGYTATKKFGGSPLLGITMGFIMCNASLITPSAAGLSEINNWNFFGLDIPQIGYQSTVLPVIASSFILAKTDNWLKDKLPKIFKITSAGLALIFAGLLTFLIIGPILREGGELFAQGLIDLYENTGVFGAAIFGLLYAPCVITGMHHAFIPVQIQLLADMATTGGNFILPIAAMSNVALGGSCLAVWYLTKDKEMKAEASFSGILSILGTSEPALFGVNLKFKNAFISALLGSMVGSIIMFIFSIKSLGMGAGGVMGYLLYTPQQLLVYTIGMLVSAGIAFALTVLSTKLLKAKGNEIVYSEKEVA